MTISITTRSGKGSELSWLELDGNFTTIKAAIDLLTPSDIAFTTAIPFTGNLYMAQQSVSAVFAFTVAASPVKGAKTYLRLVADGTNLPTFTGMKEWGGSAGYDNRSGIVNEIEFFYDGIDFWYFINQAVGAVAADIVAPTASGSAVANATPTIVSIMMSEAMDAAYVPAAPSFTVSGHTVASVAISGSTISLTCTAAFVNGEAARTVSYTQPGSNFARDLAGNLLANFSGLAITNNVGAVATAPAQVTGLTLGTATSTTQPLSWSVPSDGGSAITDYVIQQSPAGAGTWTTFADGTSTAAATTVTGLTASTSYDYRVAAVNAVGAGTNSATSTGSTAAPAGFTTLNPADKDSSITLSAGNLHFAKSGGTTFGSVRGVSGKTSGKWYFEVTQTVVGTFAGVGNAAAVLANFPGATADSVSGWTYNDNVYSGGSVVDSFGVGGDVVGDVIGVQVDLDGHTIKFRKNAGSWSGAVSLAGITGTIYPMLGSATGFGDGTATVNFGTTAFAQTVPSGFAGWN